MADGGEVVIEHARDDLVLAPQRHQDRDRPRGNVGKTAGIAARDCKIV